MRGGRIHRELDRNAQLAVYALTLFNKLKDGGIPRVYRRLETLTFLDSREACPIQAADILAYQMSQDAPRMRQEHAVRFPSDLLNKLLTGIKSKHDLQLYNSKGLKLLLGQFFNPR